VLLLRQSPPIDSSMKLANSLDAWNSTAFDQVLKDEIEGLEIHLLPLHQSMVHGSHLAGDDFTVTILTCAESDHCIRVKLGVFFRSVIAGCSCADDPTPVDESAEYGELWCEIDKRTAKAVVTPVAD